MIYINPYIKRELLSDSAIYDFLATAVGASDSTWKNRLVATSPSKNIIYNSSGLLPNEGTFTAGSFTQHFADGPNFVGGAARLNTNASAGGGTSGAYYKPYFNRNLPAGSYTFKCKMKSNVAGVTQKLRWGTSTAGATTLLDVTDVWTEFSFGFTSVTNNGLFIASQISLGAMSVLIDELQLYNNLETIPAYTADGNDGHISKAFGVQTPISKNGVFVTNSALGIHSPAFPVAKTWTAMTFLFAVRVTSDTDQSLWACITDAYYGTLNNVNLNINSGQPQFTFGLVNGSGKLNNQDFVIIGANFNAGNSESFINEVRISNDSGSGTINAQIFSLFCRLAATNPFLGDIAFCTIWDRKLTLPEWHLAAAQARERLVTMNAPYRNRNWYIAHGDSITVAYNAPQGPSFAYQMATALFTGGEHIGHINLATGGYTLSLVEGGLSTMLARIEEVKLGRGKAIVSILVGRNDNGTLISNAACDAYWIRLKALYTSLRNAGAKVIAITPLPAGTIATNGGPAGSWETYRNYLGGLMRAEPAAYDALADFGNPSVSIMGDVATANDATYYVSSDMVHPMLAGHNILVTIFQPILQSFL